MSEFKRAPRQLSLKQHVQRTNSNRVTEPPQRAPLIARRSDIGARSFTPTPQAVLYLQRTIGNRAVARLLQRSSSPSDIGHAIVPPKATARPASLRHGQEEDPIAAPIRSDAPQSVQPQRTTETSPSVIGREGGEVGPETTRHILRSQAGGRPLPKEVRRYLEPRMNADLGAVRIHTGDESVQLSRAVGAQAFTTGKHIYYGAGQSPKDLRLTAHEVVHTMQQGAVPAVQRAPGSQILRRWPWSKDPNRPGTSFDNPKQFKDPKILKEHRGTKKYVVKGAPLSKYDSDTGDFDDQGQKAGEDYNLKKNKFLGKKKYRHKTRTMPDGSRQKGVIFEGYWVPVSSIEKRKAGYVSTTDTLTPETDQDLDVDDDGGQVARNKPRLPRPEDVVQAKIGDCWLEAALISIAATNPEYIQDMMRDNGDTVTVRLYDVNRKDPKNPTFKPRYISVSKSTAQVGGANLYQGGALWVSMIQKAYAAGGFTGEGSRKSVGSKRPGGMSNIAGGFSRYAFETLLGRSTETSNVDSGKAQNKPRMLKELPWSTAEITRYIFSARPTDNYDGLVSYSQIFQDKDKVDRWMAWVRRPKNSFAIDKLYLQRRQLALTGLVPKGTKILGKFQVGYQAEVRLEHLEALFQAKGLDDDLVAPLMQYLKHFFPGKRGTGNYTDKQNEIYAKIKDALDDGKMVATGTPEIIGRTSTGEGHSAGESKSKGLVGGHAYAVLAVTEVNNKRFVRVRNPWGSYARSYNYQAGRMKAEEFDDSAESNLELSDFTKRFDELYVT